MNSYKFFFYIIFFSLFIFAFPHSYAKSDSINQDWYSKAIQNIEKQEYNITFNENLNSYQSPNRKNNLRFTYKNNGFTVQPRATEITKQDENNQLTNEKIKVCDDWNAEFTLLGYGRNKTVENTFKGKEFTASENTAYVKDENIKIDYINNKDGMRQNFTIYNKPESKKGLLNLQFNINTKERVLVGADALVIKSKNAKEYMKYNSLKIWDADGKELRGWFENIKNSINEETKTIQIVVNDENAKYPITIDPLSTTADWSAEGNQVGAAFGLSVSTAGDVNGDGYNDVIIAAPYVRKVFVYYGSASGLSSTANWSAESNQEYARFGNSVSTTGDVNGDGYSDIIVGSPYFDNGEASEGAAFVYYGSALGLSATANWSAESNQGGADFGFSVSTAGDVNGDGYSDVIVGAPDFDNGGAAFVYYGSASGLSTNADWSAESNQGVAEFGISVSTAGDLNGDGYSDVLIGTYWYANGETQEGAAFVYYGSAPGLSSAASWSTESNQTYAHFGQSVSTAGDVNGDGYSDIIVGAPYFSNGEIREGAAFVYFGSVSGLSVTADWSAEGNQDSVYFGASVFTAGDVNGDGYSDIIVGAPDFDNRGAAFVYQGSPSGLSSTNNWNKFSNQTSSYLGYSVSTAGDVNGDGYSDVIVGAPYFDNGETDEGMTFVYYGSSTDLSATTNWYKESNQNNAHFGWAVSTAGDVNGDGYSDIIVGAPNFDNGETDEGKVFGFFGSSSGLSATVNWTAESNQASANFGNSLSTAGDVNGDGFSDVLIGANTTAKEKIMKGKLICFWVRKLVYLQMQLGKWKEINRKYNTVLAYQ